MKASLRTKLDTLIDRHEEIAVLLGDPDVINDQERFRNLSKEYAELEPLVASYKSYLDAQESAKNSEALLRDDDPDMREMAAEELSQAKEDIKTLEAELETLLIPKDPNDTSNVFLEVRAGTGGDEASIFAGDLYRMYARFAESKGWKVELLGQSQSEQGGYKEVIVKISGQAVYSQLKFESGAHRVQRVPVTESQGRVHTSACTVAVMPEVEIIDEVDINANDLKVDTYRASGAGGQHVNKTDSAVRITHLPTGIVIECQDERSQHKNRARAMSLLQAKILSEQQAKQQSEQAETRRNLVGSGDRSERIRTYNYPQGRVTDHRINLTLYKLAEVMEGSLAQVIEPLIREHQMDQLSAMGDE